MESPAFIFGPFRLEPATGRLLRDGAPVQLGHRALRLLGVLAEADGAVVKKLTLMDRVWPGALVEEGNLSVQIAALRRAMGTDRDGRDWVLTVPREGYRLVMASQAAKVDPHVRPNIAVLPFQDMGGAARGDYFADGVVEQIISALGRFRDFAVIARNSSFVYRGREGDLAAVASDLGVRYLLTGSVRRAGQRLRISAQLVEAESGAHLWSDHFDGTESDVFDFQDRITEAVVSVVAPQIRAAELVRARRERPASLWAYDIYLQALPLILTERESDNVAARALLDEGLKTEPDDARLLALASFALEHRNTMGWPRLGPDDNEQCISFARQALERANGDAAVLVHCGISLFHVGKEYAWGRAILLSALDANPNNLIVVVATGVALLHCGSVEEAKNCFHRANRLSPRDPFAHIALCGLAHAHMIERQYEVALDFAARSLAVNPNFDPTFWMLISANAQLGRMSEAQTYLERLTELNPGISLRRIVAAQPSYEPQRMVPIFDGLQMAGMPEG